MRNECKQTEKTVAWINKQTTENIMCPCVAFFYIGCGFDLQFYAVEFIVSVEQYNKQNERRINLNGSLYWLVNGKAIIVNIFFFVARIVGAHKN